MRKKTNKQLKKDLWKVFSQYVRLKSEGECYTCRRVRDPKEMNAGHFKHGVLDYDEMNVHAQCRQCNLFWSGKLDVYAERLIDEYGLPEFRKLITRSKRALAGEFYKDEWLIEKINHYTNEIKKL